MNLYEYVQESEGGINMSGYVVAATMDKALEVLSKWNGKMIKIEHISSSVLVIN
jgi:hypothetical protein